MGSSLEAPAAARPPKVSPPRTHEGVVWTPLQEGLEKCANLRCVWLYAGPGAGKTQGVRKWLSVRNEAFAWFQVDDNDHDPIRVMYYLQHAVSALPLNPQILTQFSPNLHTDLRVFAEHWCRQVDAALDRPAFLILDDLHLLGRAVIEHPVFRELLTGRFERLCVLVISRSSPENQGLVQNESFTTLGPDYLVLTRDSIRDLLLGKGLDKSKLTPGLLDGIASSSGGWVAAIRLLGEGSLDTARTRPQYDALLFRLITSELLDPLSKEQQRVFCLLSYLASFSTQLVDALDPSGQTRQTILRYCHENQFVDLLEQAEPPSLRFHPLLREALQRVEEEASPLGIDQAAARQLTDLALKERRFADALELMIRMEDWKAFVEWVSFAGLMILQRGERATLKALLDRVPPKVWEAQSTPRLRLLHGGSMVYSDSGRAMAMLEDCLKQCLEEDITGFDLALTICLGAEAVLGAGEHASRLTPFWRALDARVDDGFGPEIPPALSFRVAVMANLLVLVCEPKCANADRWLEHVLTQAEKLKVKKSDSSSMLMNLSTLMMVWASHGYPERAEQLRPVFDRMSEGNDSAEAKVSATMVEFSFALVSGHFPKAFELFDQGGHYASLVGTSRWKLSMTGMAGALAASVQDLDRVQSLLASIAVDLDSRLGVGGGRFNRAMLAGTYEASRGNTPESVREFKLARDIVDRSDHHMMGITSRCALSAVHAQNGELNRAQRYVDEALQAAQNHGIRVGYWAAWTAQAYLALKRGDRPGCHEALTQVLQEIRSVGYYTFPTSWTGQFSELLCEALEAEIEVPFVRTLISRNERYSRKDPRPHPQWPAKYEFSCMGSGSLLVDGEAYEDSFVPGNGLYELVMTMMWLGGRDVADHRVMNLLWPGKSTNLKNPLHQSLKRLRQNFKRTHAVIYDSGRLSLHPGMWRVDLWELEARLEDLVHRCLAPQALPESEREALQKELNDIEARCALGFASPQAMPISLRGLAQEQAQKVGHPRLLPEPLIRGLAAAQDALKRA